MDLTWKNLFLKLGVAGLSKMDSIGFFPFLTLMAISLASSLFITFLYVKFYRTRATGSMVHFAFPLMGLSITAIFISIQFSLPLSLGLLGALSIVRFRTPIKEPEEIGFILVVVAASLCCATFNMLFLVVLLLITVVALFVMRIGVIIFEGKRGNGILVISLPVDTYLEKGQEMWASIQEKMPKSKLISVSENDTRSIVSYGIFKAEYHGFFDLHNDLKEKYEDLKINVYFDSDS